MGKEIVEKMTLERWLIDTINTKDWRVGKVSGVKHPKIQQETLDKIGRRQLLEQAQELEKAGLVEIHWLQRGNDIAFLDVPVDNMEELCKREGIENPQKTLMRMRKELEQWKKEAPQDWHVDYYNDLIAKVDKGNIIAQMQDKKLFQILNAISDKEKMRWKRVFSAQIVGDSKEFEMKYQKRIAGILRNYAPVPDKDMEEDEVLAEFGILTYSQTLEWKGPLHCLVKEKKSGIAYEIDTSGWSYGYVMNAQSLEHAVPIGIPVIKRIVTIENKANYESMNYDAEVLYLFCHGFFSPKERRFLNKLYEIAGSEVEFYHWSDMDYGGIRIFKFINDRVFPGVKPLHMSRTEYEEALKEGKGIELQPEKKKKLHQIEAGELEPLKEAILEKGMEIEQEVLL